MKRNNNKLWRNWNMKGVFIGELNPEYKPTWVEKIGLVQFEHGLAIVGIKPGGEAEVLSFDLNSENCLIEINEEESLKIISCVQYQHNRGNICDIPGVNEKLEEAENFTKI
jgi:hypothetical protein